PVLLVVDASAAAASIAAVVKGFSDFDPNVRIVGVVCNRVAGERHYTYLEPAIRRHTRVAPLGWLPRRQEWEIPERHLGLTTAEDLGTKSEKVWQRRIEQLSDAFEATVDVNELLELSRPPVVAEWRWLATPPSV